MLVRQPQNRSVTVELVRFSLQRSVPLPLGWMLSGDAAREMKNQIDAKETTKPAAVAKIIDRLPHPKLAEPSRDGYPNR
jgi:hypothetical protein